MAQFFGVKFNHHLGGDGKEVYSKVFFTIDNCAIKE